MRSTKVTRRLLYLQLALHFNWGVDAVQGCLERAGYKRYVARAKPPLSEANKRARIRWAEEHLNWTREQWFLILWIDETWVNGGRYTKIYVTRLSDEELDPTCVIDKVSKAKGWMFWGCFNGITKGPSLFWEKDWGSIRQKTYCEYIVNFPSLFRREKLIIL